MSILRQTRLLGQGDSGQGQLPSYAYLMCPPDHFGVFYEINPWMHREIQPDLELARAQWESLVSNLTEAGATIRIMQPGVSLPDMVFTADLGLVAGDRFIPARFRYAERQPEVREGTAWFQDNCYEVMPLSLTGKAGFEGGDILAFRDCLLAGYGFRTDLAVHIALADLLSCRVISVKLVDPRLYHLDVCFCPLDERRAIIAPAAWTRRGCEIIKRLVPDPLVLEPDEALTFCANSIVVGNTLIMPHCPPRVGRILERWGFTICVSPVSEFLKAGGAVHCLTLALHTAFC